MSDPTHAIRIHETGGLSEVLTWEEVDAAQAHLDLEARKTTGSTVLMAH